MFKKLKTRWKVNGQRLLLILCTFAIGGSLCGYMGRKLLNLFTINNNFVWTVLYLVLITILWPLAVIVVSIPFGQFRFFKKYLLKIFHRLRMGNKKLPPEVHKEKITRIAIFASGAGSNAQAIIHFFHKQPIGAQQLKEAERRKKTAIIHVALIVCNKPTAGVLQIAAKNKIPTRIIEKERFFQGDAYLEELKKNKIDAIVLAGFLWKIPQAIIQAFPRKIINIHPALLPKYGGKGMYGNRVHDAVIFAKEKESGITIHYVDEHYDNGDIIFQAKCVVDEMDTAETLAKKIHVLEHEHYPLIIEKWVETIKK